MSTFVSVVLVLFLLGLGPALLIVPMKLLELACMAFDGMQRAAARAVMRWLRGGQ